jgi:MFS transporter, FHS family, L-fucose permease
LDPTEASKYVSLFWGGMLIGRFMGAVELSEMKKINKQIFLVIIPVLLFFVFWGLRSWNGEFSMSKIQFDFPTGWIIVKHYIPLLALCWLLFQFGQGLAGRTLFIFALTIVALLGMAIFLDGKLAMWSVIGVGLFTSIGWPNIFSLALDRMGVLKSQVSSLLVMAILGGALLPLLQGRIADKIDHAHAIGAYMGSRPGIQFAFIIPLIAYAYIAFYGLVGHKIGRNSTPPPEN